MKEVFLILLWVKLLTIGNSFQFFNGYKLGSAPIIFIPSWKVIYITLMTSLVRNRTLGDIWLLIRHFHCDGKFFSFIKSGLSSIFHKNCIGASYSRWACISNVNIVYWGIEECYFINRNIRGYFGSIIDWLVCRHCYTRIFWETFVVYFFFECFPSR